jgi:hypothetical protein
LKIGISLLSQLVEETLDNLGLTTTGRSNKHGWCADLNESLHNKLCGNGISSGDGVIGDSLRGVNAALNGVVTKFVPVLKLGVLDVYIVVKNCSFGGEFDSFPSFSPEFIEVNARFVSLHNFESSTHAPDHSKHEEEFESFDFLLSKHNLKEFADVSDLRDNDIRNNVLEVFSHLLVGLVKIFVEQSL